MFRKLLKKAFDRHCAADKHSLDIHPGDGSRKQLSESAQRLVSLNNNSETR